MRLTKFAAFALLLTAAPLSAAPPPSVSIAAAVASPARSPDNVKLDEGRKPAQVLKFLGLKSGMNVLDLFGANAYWAEMTAPVVGPGIRRRRSCPVRVAAGSGPAPRT